MLFIFLSLLFSVILSVLIFNLKPSKIKSLLVVLLNYSIYYIVVGKWLLLLTLVSFITFISGLFSKKYNSSPLIGTAILLLSIIGLKIYFPAVGPNDNILKLAYPIGFSFFLLQSISYLIDIRRKKMESIDDPLLFLATDTYFPLLFTGPITKHKYIYEKLTSIPIFNFDLALEGLILITVGLIKNIVISGRIIQLMDNLLQIETTAGLSLLILFISPVLIFINYSALIDIVRGVSKLLNIELEVNYKSPLTKNQFDKILVNWNLSLYRWLKEYIYDPLCLIGNNHLDKLFWKLLVFIFVSLGFGIGFGFKFFIIALASFVFYLISNLINAFNCRISLLCFLKRLIVGVFSYFAMILISMTFIAPSPTLVFIIIKNLLQRNMIFFGRLQIEYIKNDIKAAIVLALILILLEHYKIQVKKTMNTLYPFFRWSILAILIILILIFSNNSLSQFLFLVV